jgi:cytochrome c2
MAGGRDDLAHGTELFYKCAHCHLQQLNGPGCRRRTRPTSAEGIAR